MDRLKEVNILRAYLALSMVALHVTSSSVSINLFSYLANQFVRYSSAIFIILSGIVLYHVEKKYPVTNYKTFLKKRYSRVVIPYICWSFLYTLYSSRHLLLDFQWDFIPVIGKRFLMGVLSGQGFVHLYFIMLVIQLYALFPLLRKWLEKNPLSLLWCSFLVTAIFQTAVYFHNLGWISLPSLPLSYVTLFPLWIFYFVFGMYLNLKQNEWKERLSNKKILLFFVWISTFVITYWDGKFTNTYAISVKPSNLLYAMSSFLFFYSLLWTFQIRQKAEKIVNWFADRSFLMYLAHPLAINLLLVLSRKLDASTLFSGIGGVLLLYILTVLFTCIGIWVLDMVPFGWLFGTRRKRRSTNQTGVVSKQTKTDSLKA